MSTSPHAAGRTPVVLFVSHEASRTGAPMHLIRLITWLKEHRLVEPRVLLLNGGPLTSAFEGLAPTTSLGGTIPAAARKLSVVSREPNPIMLRAAGRVSSRAWHAMLSRTARLAEDADLIYVNSIAAGIALRSPRLGRHPVLTHVHELGFSIENAIDPRAVELALAVTHSFLACSTGVETDLRARVAAGTPIRHIPELCDPAPHDPGAGDRWRSEHSLPRNALLVGALGSRGWRKGTDLFIQLAARLPTVLDGRPVALRWVGSGQTPRHDAEFRFDIERLGLENRVQLLPPTGDPVPFLAACDLVTVTSREDPYPLVCAEAGMQLTPIVTFDSGGAADFARAGGGAVVPYADVDAMASEIRTLLANSQGLKRRGDEAHRSAQEHTPDHLGPRFFEAMTAAMQR